jgi:mannose-6-phosphate isomerase
VERAALRAKTILPLRGQIQEYAWGSRTVLAELLGGPGPSPRPQAELWLGAHPSASACVELDGAWVPLLTVIATQPEGILGQAAARRFEGKLPFLLKLIAAETPLSIQAHPDADQARAGYAREQTLGIPIDAPSRNYRDTNAKPELLCATDRFTALCGFRPAPDLHRRMTALHSPSMDRLLAPFLSSPTRETWTTSFGNLLSLSGEPRRQLIGEVARAARAAGGPEQRWCLKLHECFGDDVGVLAPLFLNLIELKPGEAIFLEPGEPHAYLQGVGVELMGNSDNVLRGGLTPKHVDVPELLRTLTFSMRPPSILRPAAVDALQSTYSTPAGEFQLFTIRLTHGSVFESEDERNIEILFCYEGDARIKQSGGDPDLPVRQGTAWLVPAAAPAYRIEGNATLYRATVP